MMNPISRLLLTIAALALATTAVAADAPAVPAAATAPAPVVIVNFTEAVPAVYGYGTWQNNFAVAPKAGFRVQGSKGAHGDGGFCQTLESTLDLSQREFIEIALAVQPANEVPEYTVCFGDADGTQCWARLRISQLMPGQPVWLRLKKSEFTASTRDPGSDGQVDWSKIKQWHLQGDWSTHKPAQVLFIALRAR
ncbi:hypothetical protein DB347_24650 [Opitutaceae bacterium EW11]|nr:hypothetical protein DB347_24650 [Opitutaceae bacterium EW11]